MGWELFMVHWIRYWLVWNIHQILPNPLTPRYPSTRCKLRLVRFSKPPTLHPWSLTARPWKMMVGSNFSGSTLNFRGVYKMTRKKTSQITTLLKTSNSHPKEYVPMYWTPHQLQPPFWKTADFHLSRVDKPPLHPTAFWLGASLKNCLGMCGILLGIPLAKLEYGCFQK